MFVRGREVKFNLIGSAPFRRPNIFWFSLSGTLIVLSLVVLLTVGVNLGIEFKGGYLLKVRIEEPADVSEVSGILGSYADQRLDQAIVQTGDSEDGPVLILRMPYIEDSQARNETIDAVRGEIDGLYGIEETLQEEQVGSEWGREVSTKALIALGVFLVVILIYITLRLEFKMAVTAILALVHDTLITVGIYSLTGRQVTPVTVIAFMTILGYSLYDTIVVFDRVEENTNLMARSSRMSYAEMVNESVNQTLMRSIGTTLTTLLPIVTILIFGGETLKDFAFALFLGVFLGAYSSIFVASPLLALWKEKEPRYAAVRDKLEAKGAREAILMTSPRDDAEAVTRVKDEIPEVDTEAGKKDKAPAGSKAKDTPAAAPRPQAGASVKKPAPAKTTARKKTSTTKGPSGGKKKKKKKKK
jgi:preprotein translocase SecF subunit